MKIHASSAEGPRESLQMKWARQCDALLRKQEDLLKICDDLPTYEETMRGEIITKEHGKEKVNIDDLPKMREDVLQSIDRALESLGYIEQEAIEEQGSYLRLEQEKERLRRVKESIEKQELSQCPPNYAIDSGIQNYFSRFTEMKDGSQEAESLRRQTKPTGPRSADIITLNRQQLTAAKMSIRQRQSILMKAAESAQNFSDLLLAVHERAQQKRKEQLAKKVPAMEKIYHDSVHADGLSDSQRGDPSIGVAEPLRALKIAIDEIAEQRGSNFWTPKGYHDLMKPICDKAYTLLGESGLEDQSRETVRTKVSSAKQTLVAGDVPRRRSVMSWLLGKKN